MYRRKTESVYHHDQNMNTTYTPSCRNCIRCYDNGGKTADRYTVVFMTEPDGARGCFYALTMDDRPFHPQGIGMHCSAMPGRHLGRRIGWDRLPPNCQRAVENDMRELGVLPAGERCPVHDMNWLPAH